MSTNHLFDNHFLESLSHKTPFFLFNKERVLKNYHQFKQLFPNSTVHYAMKANSEPEILQILAKEGSSFEVASVGELELLKGLKIPTDKMIYGTSIKSAVHIK